MLDAGQLDAIAITDHNQIDFAQAAQAKLGECIIVGEEITTLEGEIIGLFLSEIIPAGLSAAETVKRIKAQGGLVYIPHPFETVRKGIAKQVLDSIADDVDIVETYNGRTLQNRGSEAADWAIAHGKPGTASSDAHGLHGWGKTYSTVAETPTRDNLIHLLRSAAYSTKSVGLLGRLYPKLNRLRKLL